MKAVMTFHAAIFLGLGFAFAIIKPATNIVKPTIGGFKSVVIILDVHSFDMDMDTSVGKRNRDCK